MTDTSSDVGNKLYDRLKFVALVLLPAAGTLYYGLASIWELPAAGKVTATITALDTFLGVFVQYLSSRYNKSDAKYDGAVIVSQTPSGKKTYTLDLDVEPDHLDELNEVTFKIKGPNG